MLEGWEVVGDWHLLSAKATRFMQAMVDSAPRGSEITTEYAGRRRGLMLYGPGSAAKLPVIRSHIKRGGQVAMWDLGYWDRPDSMRLSVNALHPTAAQLAIAPERTRRNFDLREDADPAGPILLIGLGAKSVYAYGLGAALDWERRKVADLRTRYPDREIMWRPKGAKVLPLLDLQMRHGMPIEEAMQGCSLLVCRHSNTAVDACLAGIPVECEDGAAAALYRGNPAPTLAERAAFLSRLAWWQWSRFEGPAAWEWVEKVTHG